MAIPPLIDLTDAPKDRALGTGSKTVAKATPRAKLVKSVSSIPVKFTLNKDGAPLTSADAQALSSGRRVRAVSARTTATGRIVIAASLCTWRTTEVLFRCNLKTPTNLEVRVPYEIVAQASPGSDISAFVDIPGDGNPTIVVFK